MIKVHHQRAAVHSGTAMHLCCLQVATDPSHALRKLFSQIAQLLDPVLSFDGLSGNMVDAALTARHAG